MATKKTIKKTAKRYLSQKERMEVARKIQSLAGLLVKLRDNDSINTETKSIIKRMHKSLLDVVSFSARLDLHP